MDTREQEFATYREECVTILRGVVNGTNKVLPHTHKCLEPGWVGWESPAFEIATPAGVVEICLFFDGYPFIDYVESWKLTDGIERNWSPNDDDHDGGHYRCPMEDLTEAETTHFHKLLREARYGPYESEVLQKLRNLESRVNDEAQRAAQRAGKRAAPLTIRVVYAPGIEEGGFATTDHITATWFIAYATARDLGTIDSQAIQAFVLPNAAGYYIPLFQERIDPDA